MSKLSVLFLSPPPKVIKPMDTVIVQYSHKCEELLEKIDHAHYRVTVLVAEDTAAKRIIAKHNIKKLPAMVRSAQVFIGAEAILRALKSRPVNAPAVRAVRRAPAETRREVPEADDISGEALGSESIANKMASINERRRNAVNLPAATTPEQTAQDEVRESAEIDEIESTLDMESFGDMNEMDKRMMGAMMSNLGTSHE